MAIKFCPRCGSMMKPYKSGNRVVWKCPKCGYVEDASTAVSLIEKTVYTPRELRFKRLMDHEWCTRCGYTWREYE